jgi:hypothetical protein
MPGATPTYGFPYQTLADLPDGPSLGEDLANAVETEIARIDGLVVDMPPDWTTYVPVVTSGGTAPSLGNGTLTGAYVRVGKLVHCRIFFQFGSTTNLGTGTLSWSLPLAAASPSGLTTAVWVGSALLRDQGGTPGRYVGVCTVDAGASVAGVLAEGGSLMTNSVPFTWASTDYMSLSVVYEIP